MIKRFYKIIVDLSNKQVAFLLFFLAFVLRVAFAFYAYHINIMQSFVDDRSYFELAEEIIKESKIFYSTDLHPLSYAVGPGLPWINALTIKLLGSNWLGIFLITSFISALVTLFTYLVASKVVNKQSAILAGLWSCFYLFYYKFCPTAGKDIWMSLFMILIIYFLIVLFNENKFSYYKLVLLAFIYAYSFHLDERFFIFAPFIVLYILIYETQRFTRFKLSKSILFTFTVILLMIPWLIRNYIYHEKVVIVSSRTERITDKFFGYSSRHFPWDDIDDLYGRYYIYDYQIDSVLSGLKTTTDGGHAISDQQRQAMLKGKLPHPFQPLEAFWVRTKTILSPFQFRGEYQKTGYFYYKKSLRHNLASLLFYGTVFLMAFPGFYFLYKMDRNIFYMFLSIIIIYTLIHAIFVSWTTWRYRLPLDSIFIIVGCNGMGRLYQFFYYNLKNI